MLWEHYPPTETVCFILTDQSGNEVCLCISHVCWTLCGPADWCRSPTHSECSHRSLSLGSNPSSHNWCPGEAHQSMMSCPWTAGQSQAEKKRNEFTFFSYWRPITCFLVEQVSNLFLFVSVLHRVGSEGCVLSFLLAVAPRRPYIFKEAVTQSGVCRVQPRLPSNQQVSAEPEASGLNRPWKTLTFWVMDVSRQMTKTHIITHTHLSNSRQGVNLSDACLYLCSDTFIHRSYLVLLHLTRRWSPGDKRWGHYVRWQSHFLRHLKDWRQGRDIIYRHIIFRFLQNFLETAGVDTGTKRVLRFKQNFLF